MQPNDANFLGKVFGGKLLSLIDLCAYTTAVRFSGEVCVTASFDRVDFHEPIDVGEVVILDGAVVFVGRTSIDVVIEVHAENIFRQTRRHTNTARVTMVAIREGRPVEVPRLVCVTREDREQYLEARLRRELSSRHRDERRRIGQTFRDATDSQLESMVSQEKLS